MNELSIEEKAKRYDEALKVAKNNYETIVQMDKDCTFAKEDIVNTFHHIFPELKESEDEKLREQVIYAINQLHVCECTKNKLIAWVEKQGKQKLINKVEPKFKFGDWLVHNERKHIIKVVNPTPMVYKVVDALGYHHTITDTAIENNYHLWTIQDAKDGDVLVLNNEVFIYAHRKQLYSIAVAHCFVDSAGSFHLDGEFGYKEYGKTISPATTEQRDILMKAMADVGYKFDFWEKELIKK